MNRNNSQDLSEDIDLIRAALNRPIVIVGMMGVGKSHVGRKLAEALKVPFRDSDTLIESRAGYSINEIFEIFGEEKFRESEARIIRETIGQEICILATGGGAIMNSDVRTAVRENCVSVWLRASLPDLTARLKKSRNRPLLKNGDIETILATLMGERKIYYEESNVVVDVVQNSVEQTLREVIKSLCGYLKADSF